MGEVRCRCPCHWGSVSDRWRAGVSVSDPLEAAIACVSCAPIHCPALLSKRCANDPAPENPLDRTPWVDVVSENGEGAES